jgi:hypothetical protein
MMMRKLILVLLGAVGLMAQTAKFPNAIATDQDLLRAYDRAASYLWADIDASTLTIPVEDGSSFAGASYFSVTIGDERMLICSVGGNYLTVCPGGRGFSGTTATIHLVHERVAATITAWHHNSLVEEIKAIESTLGTNLANVEKPLTFTSPLSRSANTISCPTCIVSSGSYSDPSWLSISKAKVGLGNVENTALSTWAGSANITTLGTISSGTIPAARISGAVATATALAANGSNCPSGQAAAGVDASGNAESCVEVPNKQLNFAVGDGTSTVPAQTGTIWRPERATATVTQVACKANTGDAVVTILNGATNMLASNLTCGNGTWTSTASFNGTNNQVTTAQDLAYQVVSGTMSKIAFSIRYTGN